MKKGKTSRIVGFNNSKVSYGTVDSKNFKSVYLNLQSWVSPKQSYDNWERIVSNFSRQIKHTIFEILDPTFFKDKYIIDLDLRTSGIVYGKKSFMNLEITFFIAKNIEFKSTLLRTHLQNLTSIINSHNFTKNTYFKFEKTKKLKTIDIN